MDGNRREITLAQKLVKLSSSESTLDKDNDLIEGELIKQLIQSAVLLLFVQFDVVLCETVQSKLGVTVNVDLEGILHELLADWLDLRGEGSTEHHNLLLGRSGSEDILDIASHI